MFNQELPFKRKSEFQHISELLPAMAERIIKRSETPLWWPIPDDEEEQVRWVSENL